MPRPTSDIQTWIDRNACFYDDIQNVDTPVILFDEVFSEIGKDLSNKKILILYNIEAVYLLLLNYNVKPQNIYFFTQSTRKSKLLKETKVNILYTDMDNDPINYLNNIKMKFDVVIGNPPYDKGKNHDFYVDFLSSSIDSLLEDGHLVYIIPNKYFQPQTKANKIISKFEVIKAYHNVSNYFKAEGNEKGTYIGAVHLKKCNKKTNLVDCVFDFGKSKVNLSKPTPSREIDNKIIFSILNKVFSDEHKKLTFTKDKRSIFVCRQWKRWNSITKKGGNLVFNLLHSDSNKFGKDGKFLDKKDNLKYWDWYLSKSNVIRFITYLFSASMNVQPMLWNHIPDVYLKNINDLGLYKHFNLTEEEITYIESIIK